MAVGSLGGKAPAMRHVTAPAPWRFPKAETSCIIRWVAARPTARVPFTHQSGSMPLLSRPCRTACAVLLLCAFAGGALAGAAGSSAQSPAAVYVAHVAVSGNSRVSDDEIRPLAQGLEGRHVEIAEIETLRHRLTRLYVERGYISSGAVFGDPLLVDGVLNLKIVEGQVGDMRVAGLGGLRRAYLSDRLVESGAPLHLPTLQERYQMLLADPLFERIDLSVQPGLAPGEAVLDVGVVRARPWDLVLFADNHRSASTGEMQAGVLGRVRNLTGLGDAADLQLRAASGGEHLSGGWSVPLGSGATRFSARFETGDARIVEAPLDDADVRSRVRGSEVSFEYDLLNGLDRRAGIGVSYGERSARASLFGAPFSFSPGDDDGLSRVRVWRLSQSFSQRTPSTALALRSIFSAGRSNAVPVAGIDPERLPERDFLHWSGQVHGVWRPVGSPWWLQARVALQKAQDRLAALERFAIGGHATVRGYRENSLVRDNGYAGAIELHWRPDRLPDWLDPFLFHDRGAAWNRNEASAHLRSIGAGVAVASGAFRGELVWSHAIDPRVASAERRLQDRGIHLAVSYAF